MKRIIFAVAVIIATLSTFTSAQAQETETGKFELGGRVSFYSGWNGMAGIGAYGRYDLGRTFRIEPSIMILCEQGASMDLSVDLQCPFQISKEIELYPLAGVSLNDPGVFGVGINLGGGLGYDFNERWGADFGVKWMISTQDGYANPVVISFGCGYKF